MTAEALVTALRARGVELVAAGDRIRYRPADALTDEDRAALRQRKGEVLALLVQQTVAVSTPPHRPPFTLCTQTVTEVLGARPDPRELESVHHEVAAAIAQLGFEVQTGRIGREPLVIRDVPLALWVDLSTIAALLRAGKTR